MSPGLDVKFVSFQAAFATARLALIHKHTVLGGNKPSRQVARKDLTIQRSISGN
jgi:hypothetical protein